MLNINMKYQAISKMQFLLFQNYLFFDLLWDFIFLLISSYMPLPNLALLEWRRTDTGKSQTQVPGLCTALLEAPPSSPVDRKAYGMGIVDLQTQQRYYIGHKIYCLLLTQWHFFPYLHRNMIWEVLKIWRIF